MAQTKEEFLVSEFVPQVQELQCRLTELVAGLYSQFSNGHSLLTIDPKFRNVEGAQDLYIPAALPASEQDLAGCRAKLSAVNSISGQLMTTLNRASDWLPSVQSEALEEVNDAQLDQVTSVLEPVSEYLHLTQNLNEALLSQVNLKTNFLTLTDQLEALELCILGVEVPTTLINAYLIYVAGKSL